jgi:TonB family protein
MKEWNMKNRILLFVLAVASSFAYAQPNRETPLTFVQEMPKYPGGEKALYEFLYNNITYPEQEKSQNIEGTVFVNFVVEKDGSTSNFTVTRGVQGGGGLDREALHACMKLGGFYPGTQNGVPQRVFLTIPIKFTLSDDEEEVKLSKMELWQIEMDGKYICTMLFELAEAQKSGDLEKMNKLSADFEIKATALEKRYAKGSIQEKELERIVQPCLDEATKSMSGE